MSEETEKRVTVHVPRGYSAEEPNLLISINGKNYLLPRGKPSQVPEAVAYELERARRAQEQLDQTMDRLAGA